MTWHSVVSRDNGLLLASMMELLAGPDSYIAFEGLLKSFRFSEIGLVSDKAHGILKPHILIPGQADFAVLPLNGETISSILERIIPNDRVTTDIFHIDIAQAARLEFGAYDQFAEECILCGPGVPVTFLKAMKERDIIESFQLTQVG